MIHNAKLVGLKSIWSIFGYFLYMFMSIYVIVISQYNLQVIIYIFIIHLILPVPTFVSQQIGNKFCEGKFNSAQYMRYKSTLSKEYQKD